MAQKKISDLILRSDLDATCNIPVEDSTQSWRVTATQLSAFVKTAIASDATLITGQTADTSPQGVDSILTYDSSAGALKKATKANFLKAALATKTTTYLATVEDEIIFVSGAAGDWTLSLPAASTMTGRSLRIIRTDNNPDKTVTIDANSTETINGSLTRLMHTQYECWEIASDGSNWLVLSHKASTEPVTTTMTIEAVTTNPSKGTVVRDTLSYWREGKFLNMNWSYEQSSGGSAGSGTYLFKLPAGLVADTTLIPLDAPEEEQGIVGVGALYDRAGCWIRLYDSTHLEMMFLQSGQLALCSSSLGALSANPMLYSLQARVPITGWEA